MTRKSEQIILSHFLRSVITGNHDYLEPTVESVDESNGGLYYQGGTVMHMLAVACFTLSQEKYSKTCEMLMKHFSDYVHLETDMMSISLQISSEFKSGESKESDDIECEKDRKHQLQFTIPVGKVATRIYVFDSSKSKHLYSTEIVDQLNVHSLVIWMTKWLDNFGVVYEGDSVSQNINTLLRSILSLTKKGQTVSELRDSVCAEGGGTGCIACFEKPVSVLMMPCKHLCA